MGAAAFRLKSQGTCTSINQCQHAVLTLKEGKSKGMRNEGRERMLTAFKTPMGILCHFILSPPLLASTISQHSVCLSVSKPLRADQSPIAASASGCFSPHSTIRCFLALSFILHSYSHSSSHFLLFFPPRPLSFFILVSLVSTRAELPTVSLFCRCPPPSRLALTRLSHLLPPSHSSLTHWQKKRRRIKCKLNSPAVKR